MTERATKIVALAAGAIALGACAEFEPRGAERPADEPAFIEPKDAAIVAIDGRPVEGRRRYELRPGATSVTVRVAGVRSHSYPLITTTTTFTSRKPLTVCFVAHPGRVYLAMPEIFGDDKWAPQIVDEATTYKVTAHFPGEPGWRCGPSSAETR